MLNYASYWQRQSQWLQWRLNFNWWLDRYLPLALTLTILFACLLLWARRYGFDTNAVWILWAASMFAMAMVAYVQARRKFCSSSDALVRLELVHHLHNRLTAASGGVGAWPPPPEHLTHGYVQHWPRVLSPLLAALIILASAALVKITPLRESLARKTQEPPAWSLVQSWLDNLKEEDFLQPESIEEFQERLDALRERSPEEWYTHGSLEAGENLKEQTDQAVETLQRQLAAADQVLEQASKLGASASEATLQELDGRLGQLAQGLHNSSLAPNQNLQRQLNHLASKGLKSLTPDQIKKLQQQLKQGQSACAKCVGGGVSQEAMEAPMARESEKATSGGINRGRADAPLALKEDASSFEQNTFEGLKNDDLSRSAVGDTLGTSAHEHEVDPHAYQGATSSGQAGEAGSGGEAVWRTSLTPQENEVLQSFFK
jgi:hypothetical protein